MDEDVNVKNAAGAQSRAGEAEANLTAGLDAEPPYLVERVETIKHRYNPKYGDSRICECGHQYYRHFDSYDDNANIGCKYCQCYTFKEAANV